MFIHILWTSAPVPPSTGSDQPRCLGEEQGLLSLVLQLVRDWFSSPTFHRWEEARRGGHLSFTHATTWQTKGRNQFSDSHTMASRVSYGVLSR